MVTKDFINMLPPYSGCPEPCSVDPVDLGIGPTKPRQAYPSLNSLVDKQSSAIQKRSDRKPNKLRHRKLRSSEIEQTYFIPTLLPSVYIFYCLCKLYFHHTPT